MGKASRKKKVIGKTPDTRPGDSVDKAKGETSKKTALFLTIIVLVSFAVYFNALFNGFVYDDRAQVLDNPWIKDVKHIPEIFSKSVWSFKIETFISNYYRPMMHAIYMLNYYIFGLKPWGFHLVNVLFHCGVSVLVFLIIQRFLNEHSITPSSAYLSPPFIAALLFATHPIHTEAVTWVAGLPEVSFTFFSLLSFYLYLLPRETFRGAYIFSTVSFFIAVFCKEMALVLPMILVAYDYIFRREKKPVLDYLKGYIPYVMVASVYLVLRFHILGGFVPVKSYTDLSAYQYVINVFPLFMKYLEKLLFPVNLNFWHSFHPIKSIIEPEGILSLTITAVFCVLSLISIKRNRVVFFGLLFVAVALLPVFYIPGIPGKPFAERYLYLPSFGFVILVAIFFAWIKAKIPGGTIISTMVSIALMGAYFVSTVSRNAAWNDNYILWSDTVRKSPDGALPRNNLGNALMKVGRIDEAIEQYNIALRLEPDSSEAHNNLGGAYYMKDDIDKALGHFKIAIALNPDNVEAHNNLGSTYLVKGLLGEALAQYHIALRLKPDYAEAHYNMGLLHRRMGSEFGAKDEFGKALRVNPNLATSR